MALSARMHESEREPQLLGVHWRVLRHTARGLLWAHQQIMRTWCTDPTL